MVDQDADNYLAFEVYSDGSTVNALVRNVAGGGITFPVAVPLTAAQGIITCGWARGQRLDV